MENQKKSKSQLLREIEELERWIDELTSGSFDCICREKWIKRHEQNLQAILDAVPAFIFYKDADLRYIQVNKSLADAT
jgi:PAS domain-containing protein